MRRLHMARPLRVRPFAFLWSGQTISSLGDGVFFLAATWEVLLLTHSATAMGGTMAAETVPIVVFIVVGGVAADRFSQRFLMLASEVTRTVVVTTIALMALLHVLQFWHLVAMAFLFGVTGAFFEPAYRSVPAQLLPPEELISANALISVSLNTTRLIGPIVGALLIRFTGIPGAFVFNAATFAISATFIAAMRMVSVKPGVPSCETEPVGKTGTLAKTQSFLSDVHIGFAYVRSVKWLWVSIVIAAFGNVFWGGSVLVLLPKLVTDAYGSGADFLGLLRTINGVGLTAGAFFVGGIRQLRHRGSFAYGALLMSSLAIIAIGVPVSPATGRFVAVAAMLVTGFGVSVFGVIWATLIQELVPRDELGRVNSLDMGGSYLLLPAGYLVIGLAGDYLSTPTIFMISGIVAAVLTIIALSIREVRCLD